MKLRLLLGTAALAALLGTPSIFAQQSDPDKQQPDSSPQQTSPTKQQPDAGQSQPDPAQQTPDAKQTPDSAKPAPNTGSSQGPVLRRPDSDQSQPAGQQSPDSTQKQPHPGKQSPDSDKSATDSNTPQASLPPVVQQPDDSRVKHDGSKRDVDAIGNRNVGKRGLGDWYSLESEIRMGKEYAQQVEASAKLIQDPVITEYVNRIGQNLVRNSDAQVPFTIKVIDSDEVNAFALPGGFFYVNTGLILAADEESELAGVMAHEIAHVAARHATRQMTRAQWANIGTIPLIFVGGGIGYAVRSVAGLALPMSFLSFQRGFESEADYLGLQYMYKSGYDPNAFVQFFEKLQAREKKKPGTLAKAFSTHPPTPDRIAKSQDEIARILPARPQYIVTTSEFDQVKARLAALENRRKLVTPKDENKPSLRRTSNSDKTSTSDGKNGGDDDRPTLHRRDDSN
jgi:hypothetical protein